MPHRLWHMLIPVAAMAVATLAVGLGGLGMAATVAVPAAVGLAAALLVHATDRPGPSRPGQADAPETSPPGDPEFEREILGLMPMPLFLIERNGRIGYANTAAVELFPRLAGGSHYTSVLRAPDFLDAVAEGLAGLESQTVEIALMLGGQEKFLQAHLSRLPRRLRARSAPLLVLVEDHTRDRRLDRLRADFVANASHEMRTPLTAIIGYIETLQGPARDDSAARERFLAIMARQSERMRRLVDDLMSLNRIEMSEHVPPRTACQLPELVREAVAAVSPTARKAGIALQVSLEALDTEITGDRDQLIQVLINLLDNAMKYGGQDGPIRISAAAPSPSYPGMVGVSVRDEGPGIAREHLPRLTERFYRVSAQTSRQKGGTGLGLAIVKHVINRHRGELQVESVPGEGSCFTVWLPRRAVQGPSSPADRPALEASG